MGRVKATRHGLAGLALLLALAAGAGAQRPAPPFEPFGESIDVRVVNVETVVTDEKGERVKGLSRDDFQLLVDGREVPVELFAEVAGGRAAPASETVEAGQEAVPAPAGSGEAVPRSFLIFIDEATCIAAHRDVVVWGLERDVRGLAAADQVAVVAYDGLRLDVLSGWTRDKEAVAGVLEQARKRPAGGVALLASRRSANNDAELLETAAETNDLYVDGEIGAVGATGGEIGRTAASLQADPQMRSELGRAATAAGAALRGFAQAPGRKAMLLLAGGWSLGGLVRPVILEANRLGYTLYPVDVQGIDTALLPSDVTRDQPAGTFEVFSSVWEQASDAVMEAMARATGGKASLNSARVHALARAAEDAGDYYWLSFTPDWKGDSRNHRIVVKVRQPGLTARARAGFSDLSREDLNALAAEGILDIGGDPKTRQVALEAGAPKLSRGRMKVPLTIAVPTAALLDVVDGSSHVLQGTLTIRARDSKGHISTHPDIKLRLRLPRAPEPGSFGRHRVTVNLPRGDQHLVVTLQDAASGSVVWGECQVRAQG